jgi:fused-like protein
LKKIYHENVIQLLDSFETNTEFCLITELAPGQLYEILEEDKKLPEGEIKFIARQLVAGLFYLHSNNIIHRDIKPQNILISANGIIKICDFGFARAIESKAMITSIKGTPLYMAPELLREYPYNQKADLWSLGVILYELYVGQPPFYTNSFPTLMNKIMNESIKYPDSMSYQFKDFLKGLLVKNHKERWDWNKILEHSFVKETDKDTEFRIKVQDNYKNWIMRLKNEKVFNLYECETFLSKFSSELEVESGTKNFSAFEGDKGSGTFITSTNPNYNSKYFYIKHYLNILFRE